ncbi:unnamed protein product, partial [Echinostoma caproni]|uniref:CaMBD domain-containing protein n=1 Tax=Echinostoma caproni TaxID=27848 RepID=A0A183A5Y5_9TREM
KPRAHKVDNSEVTLSSYEYEILNSVVTHQCEYIKDWRISVTRRRVLQVVTELVVCSIHPVPGIDFQLEDTFSPYLLLILPMIGRFYLAFRALLLHSKMFNDAGSRSIGAMNKVCFDLRFVLKTLMTLCPVKTLLVFIVSLWLILSWTLRACELEQGEHHLGLLNSAWLISVTFLSIGYGDIVPHTSCGRLVAVTGSACTALLVAVFSRKLEMTKAEKHVLHFMEANKITKHVKHCAANVLRETWLLYKHAKLMPSFNPNRVRVHQRKFLQAIYRRINCFIFVSLCNFWFLSHLVIGWGQVLTTYKISVIDFYSETYPSVVLASDNPHPLEPYQEVGLQQWKPMLKITYSYLQSLVKPPRNVPQSHTTHAERTRNNKR